MRRDVLAAGATKASFAGGMGESDVTRNIMSDEDRAALEAEQSKALADVEEKPKPKKVFRPLGEVLLVRRAEAEELGEGLLITETIEKDKPAEGTVLAIGASVNTVNVGERVVFGKYAGQEYKLNGEVLLLMELREIQGVVEDERPFTASSPLSIPSLQDIKLFPDTTISSTETVDANYSLHYRVTPGTPVGEA